MSKPIEIQIQNADPERISIYEAVANLKRDLIPNIEMQRLMARLTKEHYDALVANGFTEDQALFLIK